MRAPRTVLASAAAVLLVTAVPVLAQESADVTVVDNAYQAAEVTIDAGGTVNWASTASLPHSITADDSSFDSNPDCGSGGACMQNGDTFAQAFSEPGEYAYYCRIHGAPGGVGMSGVVVVTAAGQTEEPTEEPTSEPTEDDGGAEVTGSISVSDHTSDGSTVTVDSVTIQGANGFVVVHLDQDGAPGPVLGHVAVEEGTSTDLTVPLDEPLAAETTVWPMLHVDAGELGTYEFPGPDGPVTAGGDVVMAPLVLSVADDATGGLAETGIPVALLTALAVLLAVAGGVVVARSRPGSAA